MLSRVLRLIGLRLRCRGHLLAGLAAVLVVSQHVVDAQLVPYNVKYNSGQNVQPVYEGWLRNADGTFTMHFGYLNRNYVEELSVPVGPNNHIEPGGPDRGQPGYFYPRINRYSFSVTVPKDWDKTRELVWTLTANGKTDKAFGILQADWEIDQGVILSNTVLSSRGRGAGNQPPVLKLDPIPQLAPGRATPLTAVVTDDGLPKGGGGRRRQATGQETPPTLQNMPEAPVNVPDVRRSTELGRRNSPPAGLSVSWIVWRGPGGVDFEPGLHTPVKDGKAVTNATFHKPGDYVLRARATDTVAIVIEDVKVTVPAAPSGSAAR